MIVHCDEETGYAAVDLYGDGRPIRLRRPKLRQWADWSSHSYALATRLSAAASGEMDARMMEALIVAGPITALNWEMITSLAGVALPATPDPELALALADQDFTNKMLGFWWECPLAPWETSKPKVDPDADDLAPQPGARKKKDDDARQIGTSLVGAMGALSIIYQALATIGMGAGFAPPEIDEFEIWQCAVLLGRDLPYAEQMEAGGEARSRYDGQVEEISYGRDPSQPRFFGPNSDPARTFAWLERKRLQREREAQSTGTAASPQARARRHRRAWNR